MKYAISLALAATLMIGGTAMAEESKPIQLSAAQMDSVTAGAGQPYGKILIDVTGRSFGQFIGPAKKAGTSVHGNYAGGVKALVEAALAGQHPIPN
jgi:hypothetical protein